MAKPDMIRDRNKNDRKRKKAKDEWDERFNFSDFDFNSEGKFFLSIKPKSIVSDEVYHRLLDEGMVVLSDGSPRFYLKKEVITNWYNELDEDYIGTFNDHHEPYKIVGEWRKKDLRLVDIGGGRVAVDVIVQGNLHEEYYATQDLITRSRKYGLGISAELEAEFDWELTDEYGFAVFESINLDAIGIVTGVGNVNSGGLVLENEEENEMKFLGKTHKKAQSYLLSQQKDEDKKPNQDQDGEFLSTENLQEIKGIIDGLVEQNTNKDIEIARLTKDNVELSTEVLSLQKQLNQNKTELSNSKALNNNFMNTIRPATIVALEGAQKEVEKNKEPEGITFPGSEHLGVL